MKSRTNKVAGIIMLNESDGEKKFLVRKNKNHFSLVLSSVQENRTSLASILEELKLGVKLDISKMDLLELSNANIAGEKVPLFVFGMDCPLKPEPEVETKFVWESPSTLRNILTTIDIGDTPMFQ